MTNNRQPPKNSCRRHSGQAAMEFVIMLVLGTILALALLTMFRTVSSQSDLMTERVSFSVP